MEIFLAVEAAIPPDHPASILAIPIGIVIFVGSVYLLLWSNYGAKKAAALTGVAWFGFAAILGIFWWFGAPGIPPGLGINHLPGQPTNEYAPGWYAFEPGSERAEFFSSDEEPASFVPSHEYLGVELPEGDEGPGLQLSNLDGLLRAAVERMKEQFLPVDENGIALIGAERRAGYMEEAAAAEPEASDGQAPTFLTAQPVSDPLVVDDEATGTRVAMAEFQAYANFVDADGVPLEPVPVGEPTAWFALYDPGAEWLPSAVWTGISLFVFLLSLAWLDRMEQREKRRASDEVEEPERLAVPIAQ